MTSWPVLLLIALCGAIFAFGLPWAVETLTSRSRHRR